MSSYSGSPPSRRRPHLAAYGTPATAAHARAAIPRVTRPCEHCGTLMVEVRQTRYYCSHACQCRASRARVWQRRCWQWRRPIPSAL